jgi:glycosyltransferase involved in cell wall biosynthesis
MKQITAVIPIGTRKKVRYLAESLFGKKVSTDSILVNKTSKYKKNIFFYGITAWDYRFQRTQHLATGLAKKGYRVFFIQPDFLVTDNQIDPPFEIKQESDNLFLVRLSSSRNLFIYNELPEKNNLSLLFRSFQRLCNHFAITDSAHVVAHPFWTPLLQLIKQPIIYDCMDYHAGFRENSKALLSMENQLFSIADHVVVTSEFLRKKALALTIVGKIALIPNAGDFEHFSKMDTKKESTVLGYVGAINEWFDITLLEQLCQTGKTIELVGKVENKGIASIAKKYTNLKVLGELPYAELPQIMSLWSICLIPFLINDLTKATHPVKIYEYFATGKPVITTRLPEIELYQSLVYLVDSGSDFNQVIGRALNERQKLTLERKRVARENDWSHRVNQFEKFL